jgi:hypothetical protein
MLQATESLRAELERMMLSCDETTEVLRLCADSDGRLRLGLDTPRADDVVILCVEDKPMLIAAQDVAAGLDGAILHFRGRGDDRWGAAGLHVLQPRGGSPRTLWSAAQTQRARDRRVPLAGLRGLFRRGVPASSTTLTGSL